MKKILFILGTYFPNYSANGLCCKNVIDECIRKGWKVTCVVNESCGRKGKENVDGAEVYYIRPRICYRLRDWCELHPRSKAKIFVFYMAIWINKIQQFIMSPLWPYISPGYAKRFYNMSEQLYLVEHFNVVVAVYTPFDALYAGYKLKLKHPDIKFIPYYLDALAGGNGPKKWSKSKCNRRLFKSECFINKKADAMISMESTYEYHKNNPLPYGKNNCRYFLDIPMMLPMIVDQKVHNIKNSNRKIALFAGNITYPQRNPIPLLETFLRVCKNINVELVFVGGCNDVSIFQKYENCSKGRIRFLGKKTHNEIQLLESQADFLVNIGNENPYMVPSKIFEYMRFNKPIISTYSENNDASVKYLERYGSYHLIDVRNPIDKNADCLIGFLNYPNQKYTSDEILQKQFYQNTPKAFVETIESILRK